MNLKLLGFEQLYADFLLTRWIDTQTWNLNQALRGIEPETENALKRNLSKFAEWKSEEKKAV